MKRFHKFIKTRGNERRQNFKPKKKSEETSKDSEKEQANVCLMTKNHESDEEESLKKKWYTDSGCSKHMTGDSLNFTTISPKKSGHVTYGDNNRGKILGVGKIGKCFTC